MSIWSDELSCEDVAFDLKPLDTPTRWSTSENMILIPTAAFREKYRGKGAYDTWLLIRQTGPDRFAKGSIWTGYCKRMVPLGEHCGFRLVVTHREGEEFRATTQIRDGDERGEVRGTIRDGEIEWTSTTPERDRRDGRGLPVSGEIVGHRIEADYMAEVPKVPWNPRDRNRGPQSDTQTGLVSLQLYFPTVPETR